MSDIEKELFRFLKERLDINPHDEKKFSETLAEFFDEKKRKVYSMTVDDLIAWSDEDDPLTEQEAQLMLGWIDLGDLVEQGGQYELIDAFADDVRKKRKGDLKDA